MQLNVDDDTFRRLRIRTGRLPVSFAAGDLDKLRCEVSKSPYYSLLARAVSQLPKNTRTARLALYDRAEVALNAVVLHPEISDEQATFERLVLDERSARSTSARRFIAASDGYLRRRAQSSGRCLSLKRPAERDRQTHRVAGSFKKSGHCAVSESCHFRT